MSTTDERVMYRLNFAVTGGGDTAYGTLEFTDARGVNDSYAIALAQAMQSVVPPTGVTTAVSLDRTDRTDVYTVADLDATPPVFD
jgi:bifunctional ADP-heptose synthase (sugar kinase/adenylyltransferase)